MLRAQLDLLLFQRSQKLTDEDSLWILIGNPIFDFCWVVLDEVERICDILEDLFQHDGMDGGLLIQEIKQDFKSFFHITKMNFSIFEIFVILLILAEILFSSIPDVSDRVVEGVVERDRCFGYFDQYVVHVHTQYDIDMIFFPRDQLVEQSLKLLVLIFSVLDVF